MNHLQKKVLIMENFPHYSKNILLDPQTSSLLELLGSGQLAQAQSRIQADSEELQDLIALLSEPDVAMHIRLGISAIIEELTGNDVLHPLIPKLGTLSTHASVHIRSDACYFLGLTEHVDAKAFLQAALKDAHEEVRLSAQEAIDHIDTET